MSDAPNSVFLRLEGPLQAWGDNSKLVIRRTMEAPTKSGVIGLVCCAMGLSRQAAREHLPDLNELEMGVRLDRPGTRWWDYHTLGAGHGNLTAGGEIKRTASTHEYETLVTRREYLCDASFLVVLRGQPTLIQRICGRLARPVWPTFLGRKSCPPSRPIFEGATRSDDVLAALKQPAWRPRYRSDERPEGERVGCLVEWRASEGQPVAPPEAEVWYDAPFSFDPPVHEPRLVQRTHVDVVEGEPLQERTPSPPRARANYRSTGYQKARRARLDADYGLCVFCKAPAATVQHITYRHAGGEERHDDLRSLCRLCHDAVTMLEYGLGMGIDRINPEEPHWRDAIIRKRQEIIEFRSEETHRRHLAAEEVE